MKDMIQHILPVEQGIPLLRPFPLKFRSDTTKCVTYHASEYDRIVAAAALMQAGIRSCVMLPRLRLAS